MKKLFLLFIIIFSSQLFADFSKAATVLPKLVQQGDEKKWCPITGLNISEFYKTSYIAKLKSNGRWRQYSCLYALLIDEKQSGIETNSIQVMGAKNEKYINANKAYFLVDSSIEATFGKVSVIAFKDKKTAMKLKKEFGGSIVRFKKAQILMKKQQQINLAYMQDLYSKKLYPMGKRIFEKSCKKVDMDDFIEINELESEIASQEICGKLNTRHLQALALYLWNVKREGGVNNKIQKVKVNEEDKCPVCGMFVYKYPRWATQIFYKHGNYGHHLSFDGVKDMMKFYFNNKKWGNYEYANRKYIIKMLVTDYYKQKAIEARSAYFVIGSDIYGPMGNEFVPFANLDDAKIFKTDHKGKKILKFGEIKESLPYSLDTK